MENDNGHKKRDFIRVDCSLGIKIKTSDMAISELSGVLTDISARGAMLNIEEKLYEGLPVQIYLVGKDLQPIIGYVKWIKEDKGNILHQRVGVEFDELFAEQNDRVVEIIMENIIDEIRDNQQKSD